MKKEKDPESSIKKDASASNIKNVLLAFSGGPDSVALAYALNKSGLNLIALHCNFHLRGEESNRDQKFVEDFCSDHSIPLKVIEFDINEYLKSHKGESVEMACRNLRYEWFEKELKETCYDRIATGHNKDDNIETFLLNMLRGSGTRGLKGMLPDTGTIWRPLLKFEKNLLLNYLEANNLSYIIDSTNLESDYRRNFLRNQIIPLFKEEWEGFNEAMSRTISNIQSENLIVEFALNQQIGEDIDYLDIDRIQSFPAPTLLIKRFIDRIGPYVSTPEEVVAAIKAGKPHIRKWKLKKGELILRNGRLFIEMVHSKSRT